MQPDQARLHYVTEFLRAKPLAACMQLWPTVPSSRQRESIIRAMRQSCHQALQDYPSSAYGMKQRKDLEAALDSLSSTEAHYFLSRQGLPSTIDDWASIIACIEHLKVLDRFGDVRDTLTRWLARKTYATDLPSIRIQAYAECAEASLVVRDLPGARRCAEQAQVLIRQNPTADFSCVLRTTLLAAEAALLQGAWADAQNQAQAALEYVKDQENGFLPETFAARKVLALTELGQARDEKALHEMRSVEAYLPELAVTDPVLAAKWMALEGMAQRRGEDWEDAYAAFARAWEHLQPYLPKQHSDLGVIHLECAHLDWERNDFKAAAARLQQANDVFQGLPRAQSQWARIVTLSSQATLYRMQGGLHQARQTIRQGRSVCKGLKDWQAMQERRFALEDICLKLGNGNGRNALQPCRKILHQGTQTLSAAEKGEVLLVQGKAYASEPMTFAAAQSALQEALQVLAAPITEAERHLRAHALLDWAEWELAASQQPAEAVRATHEAGAILFRQPDVCALLWVQFHYARGCIAKMQNNSAQAEFHYARASDLMTTEEQETLRASDQCRLCYLLRRKERETFATGLAYYRRTVFAEKEEELAFVQAIRASLSKRSLRPALDCDVGLHWARLRMERAEHRQAVDVLHRLLEVRPDYLAASPVQRVRIWALLAELDDHDEREKPQAESALALLAELMRRSGALQAHESRTLLRCSRAIASPATKPCLQTLLFTVARIRFEALKQVREAQKLAESLLQNQANSRASAWDPLECILFVSCLHALHARQRQDWQAAKRSLAPIAHCQQGFGQALGYAFWALYHARSGSFQDAIDRMARARENLRHARDAAFCHWILSHLYWRASKRNKSFEHLDAACRLADENAHLISREERIQMRLDQGKRYACSRNHASARRQFMAGIELAKQAQTPRLASLEAQCHLALAECSPAAEKIQRFRTIEALYGCFAVPQDQVLARCCLAHGLLLWESNQLHQALLQIQQAHAIFHCSGTRREAQLATQYLAFLHADTGNMQRACEILRSDQKEAAAPQEAALAQRRDDLHFLLERMTVLSRAD